MRLLLMMLTALLLLMPGGAIQAKDTLEVSAQYRGDRYWDNRRRVIVRDRVIIRDRPVYVERDPVVVNLVDPCVIPFLRLITIGCLR